MTRADRGWRGLYAITPEEPDTAALETVVAAAIDGGAVMVQYRAKDAAPGLALIQARRLAAICRERGVPLIVNDSVPLALASLADGVHVGRDDAGVREARIAMPRGIVGASCYADPRRAAEAAAAGADYVAIGSVFASPTKPHAVQAPLHLLAEARAASGLPVVAIGGITTHNAPAAIAAGADMLAVVTALFGAADVRAAAGAFSRLFAGGTSGGTDARAKPRAV